MSKNKRKPAVVQNHVNALHQAYLDALEKNDLLSCDKLRLEIQRVIAGKSFKIKIEDGLNLGTKFFS